METFVQPKITGYRREAPKSKKGASTAPKDGEASKAALDASGKSPFPQTPEAALAGTQH